MQTIIAGHAVTDCNIIRLHKSCLNTGALLAYRPFRRLYQAALRSIKYRYMYIITQSVIFSGHADCDCRIAHLVYRLTRTSSQIRSVLHVHYIDIHIGKLQQHVSYNAIIAGYAAPNWRIDISQLQCFYDGNTSGATTYWPPSWFPSKLPVSDRSDKGTYSQSLN